LTAVEAQNRLKQFGLNEPVAGRKLSRIAQFFVLFANPIRDFMPYIGPISSIYDFLTFWVLLKVFMANEPLFHTDWFVESLATQTLVVFIIRTAGNPLRSRPSKSLTLTVLTVITVAIILPYTPLAEILGFIPLPIHYFLFLGAMTATYLVLVEFVKRRLMKRLVQ
jgi:Mg2+-importing ATPase